VAAGRFREDLFHRLNVVRLTLPPLRERKEDIPLLIESAFSQLPTRFIISNEAMDAIMAYDWPGNIRELKNCLERMMAFNSGPLLHFADLPSSVQNYARMGKGAMSAAAGAGGLTEVPMPARAAGAGPVVMSSQIVVPLQELERQAIQHALAQTHGDRTVAAQLLGIGRTTLYRKLKEFELT
jgi:two-component system response regulator HydG